jgi:hypothetical protein
MVQDTASAANNGLADGSVLNINIKMLLDSKGEST